MKSEQLEVVLRVDSEEIPALAEQGNNADHEQIEITGEEQEPMEVDPGLGGAPQDADDAGERTTNVVGGLFTLTVWTVEMTRNLSCRGDRVRRSPCGLRLLAKKS